MNRKRTYTDTVSSDLNNRTEINKNALSSVESRVLVDTISSEKANRARAFVIQRGGASAYKRAGDARRLA